MNAAKAKNTFDAPYSKEAPCKVISAKRETLDERRGDDTHTFGVLQMKAGGKPEKKKDSPKKISGCPFFKHYYVGVCSGHTFPYVPSTDEKKQYCMTAEFYLCLIYEQNRSMDRPGKK
jgi:hypothetical protein